jgi:glucose/arabinose dehydrogenase
MASWFALNEWVEFSGFHTYREEDAPNGQRNRVVRYDVTGTNIADTERVVVDDIPANQFHNGGRLAFGPRGYLWVTCGDGGIPEVSGDPSSLAGKILRVRPNGDPAPGNPAWGGKGAPRVFTVGHRNPQAISWLPDGTAVATEHGPSAKDEVNLLSKGVELLTRERVGFSVDSRSGRIIGR